MHCREVDHKLEAFAGGELPQRERTAVQQHLDSCRECREELEGVRQLQEVMRRKSIPPVPEGFAERVMARAREQKEAAGRESKILRPFDSLLQRPGPWRAAVAAAFLVGLGFGLLMGFGTRSDATGPPQEVARTDAVEEYRLDYLVGAPSDSLSGSFVRLASTSNQPEE